MGKRLFSKNVTVTILTLPKVNTGLPIHIKTDRHDKYSGKYSVIIPKKVAKLSVTRHLIKRRTLEALKVVLLDQKIDQSIILFPSKMVATLPYTELGSELKEMFLKIK